MLSCWVVIEAELRVEEEIFPLALMLPVTVSNPFAGGGAGG